MTSRASSFFLALLVLSCRDGTGVRREAADGSPAPASSAAPGTALEAGAGAPSFHLVARGPFTQFYPLGGRTLVSTVSLLPWIADDRFVFRPEAAETRADSARASTSNVQGSWPSDAWLVSSELAAEGGTSKLYRWNGSCWLYVRGSGPQLAFVGSSTWTGGRRLALTTRSDDAEMRWTVVAGNADVPTPVPAPRPASTGTLARSCKSAMFASSLLAFPSGLVLVAGSRCEGPYTLGDAVVQRWTGPSVPGTVESLLHDGHPLRSDDALLVGADEKDLYVVLDTYVGHFDGADWTEVEDAVPAGERILRAERHEGSSLWMAFAARGEVRTRSRSAEGTWSNERFPLPAEYTADLVRSVWEPAPGDVWAIVSVPGPTAVLLHTRGAAEPVTVIPE